MGWSSAYATHHDSRGRVDVKAECAELLRGCDIVKASLVGSTYYAAVRDPRTDLVGAIVIMTHVDNASHAYDFSYKAISETCGPATHTCPARILDVLSPTNDKYALEWRGKCRDTARRRAEFTSIEEGASFEWTSPYNYANGPAKGDVVTITKRKLHPSKARSKFVWAIDGTHSYFPQSHVNVDDLVPVR